MTPMTRFSVYSFLLFTFAVAPSVGATPPSHIQPSLDTAAASRSQQTDQIDINSASLTALRSLPGVGPVIARKIVAGRPYASVDDLKTRNVLPIATYDKIRGRISTKGAVEVAPVHDSGRPEFNSGKQ